MPYGDRKQIMDFLGRGARGREGSHRGTGRLQVSENGHYFDHGDGSVGLLHV